MDAWLDLWIFLLKADGRITAYALVCIAVLTAFELWFPAEKGQGWVGRLRNLLYLLIFKVAGLAAIAWWYTYVPVKVLPAAAFNGAVRGLLVLANLLVIDLLSYGYHRAQHRFYFLWAIHELHHSDEELNATSSHRTYWLEILVQGILISTPTLFLFGGMGPMHGSIVVTCSLFLLIFSHANLRLSLGAAQRWVISPQIHRIHHSRLPEHRDRNFAQYFPVFDRIFGSFYDPKQDEYPPTGTKGMASDTSIFQAMIRPVRIWASLFKKNGSP